MSIKRTFANMSVPLLSREIGKYVDVKSEAEIVCLSRTILAIRYNNIRANWRSFDEATSRGEKERKLFLCQ